MRHGSFPRLQVYYRATKTIIAKNMSTYGYILCQTMLFYLIWAYLLKVICYSIYQSFLCTPAVSLQRTGKLSIIRKHETQIVILRICPTLIIKHDIKRHAMKKKSKQSAYGSLNLQFTSKSYTPQRGDPTLIDCIMASLAN